MAGYFKAGDTISGQEAIARMNVHNSDGTTTVEDLFYGKSCEAKVEINKTEVKTLGKRGSQHKPNGWNGTGTLTIYYATSIFRKMVMNYIKTGKPVYFDLTVINVDPASTIGTQTVLLKDCTLNSAILAKFDVESEVMDEQMDFTFDDADLLDEFVQPVLG